MKAIRALLLVAVLSLPSFGQYSKRLSDCNQRAKTQFEMLKCASEEARRVEVRMNEIYRTLLAKAAGQPGAVEKIKVAERAWIAYRDSYMEAMYPAQDKQREYGSMFPTEANLLRARLTRQHTSDLEDLLHFQYDPPQR